MASQAKLTASSLVMAPPRLRAGTASRASPAFPRAWRRRRPWGERRDRRPAQRRPRPRSLRTGRRPLPSCRCAGQLDQIAQRRPLVVPHVHLSPRAMIDLKAGSATLWIVGSPQQVRPEPTSAMPSTNELPADWARLTAPLVGLDGLARFDPESASAWSYHPGHHGRIPQPSPRRSARRRTPVLGLRPPRRCATGRPSSAIASSYACRASAPGAASRCARGRHRPAGRRTARPSRLPGGRACAVHRLA